MDAGYPAPKLTLWAAFSFLRKGVLRREASKGHIGSAKTRAELKVTDLRWRSPICVFLQFSAKICGSMRKICALQMLEFPGEGVNLRKSAVFCENLRFGLSLSP